MSRKLTPRSSLENFKREAKRWLKALRANDTVARARLEKVVAGTPREPSLRDVQHGLALEHGYAGWSSLKAAVGTHAGPATNVALDAILAAASRGDLRRVIELIDDDPDMIDERGHLAGHTGLRTALHFAVGGSHEGIVNALLARGADPNVRDEGDNAMPLHFAAEKEHLAMIAALIEHGADPIGTGDYHELEVIGWATCFGSARPDVVDYLIAHGAKHNIFSAVATGSVDELRARVVDRRDDLDRAMDQTNHRRRPLHLAVIKRQRGALEALLELGANTEMVDASGLTPLDQAALSGQIEMAEALLVHGARIGLPAALALDRDVDAALREHAGEFVPGARWGTLIIRAAEQTNGRLVEALLRHGASANAQDDPATAVDGALGYTALHAAAFHGNREAVDALLAHGASVTARDSKYFGTPAGWASYARQPAIRDRILEGPIDMFDAIAFNLVPRIREIFDRDAGSLNRLMGDLLPTTPRSDEWTKPWWTPLMLAVIDGKPDAVRALLELGARVTVRDPEGRGLVEIAESHGHHEIARLVERYMPMPLVAEQAPSASLDDEDRASLVARFLANACPDHHVRGGHSHVVALHTAEQILGRHPEIARENIFTAVVCGDFEHVNRLLAEDSRLAREKGGSRGSAGSQSERFIVDASAAAHPKWEPLLYLCFTRLKHQPTNDNAVAIARALLDHGADPNAYFMAGDSRYSPLTGVVGEGEEARLPHPRRNELARLLLERGANPYDIQVFYDINFAGHLLWFLELAYEESLKRGRAADWDDPTWPMFDMGGYGSGARFTLDIAIRNDDCALAEWALNHGASANAPPPIDRRFPKTSLYEQAVRRGVPELAALLVAHGAERREVAVDGEQRFTSMCMALDLDAARPAAAEHPEYLASPGPLHRAAMLDRVDVANLVLALGVSPDIADPANGNRRAMHVCAYNDSPNVARLLIARGAAVDPREANYGSTPLGFAIYGQRTRMIDLLSRVSGDIWNVVFAGAVDRVRELLATQPTLARVVYPDEGTTPLMRLPGNEPAALQIATLLLEHGAEPLSRNSDGLTAADLASQRGMSAVAALIREWKT